MKMASDSSVVEKTEVIRKDHAGSPLSNGAKADRRELIERYYLEDRNALARSLGISMNALRNRALRIREELFNCAMRERDNS